MHCLPDDLDQFIRETWIELTRRTQFDTSRGSGQLCQHGEAGEVSGREFRHVTVAPIEEQLRVAGLFVRPN